VVAAHESDDGVSLQADDAQLLLLLVLAVHDGIIEIPASAVARETVPPHPTDEHTDDDVFDIEGPVLGEGPKARRERSGCVVSPQKFQ
jgi:hypothetical protein